MKVWAEHQRSTGENIIKCPLCRVDFGSFQVCTEEMKFGVWWAGGKIYFYCAAKRGLAVTRLFKVLSDGCFFIFIGIDG